MTTNPSRLGSATEFPAARHYGWFALGFLAFAVYGSLVPFDFRPVPLSEAFSRYRAAWLIPVRVVSRSDWLSNILLFIPAGFLLSGWLAVDRPRRSLLVAACVIPLVSVALSSAIEFAQVYFPTRTVSLRDVVAETIGGSLGGCLWLAFGRRLTAKARARADGGSSRAAWLLPAYLLALLLSRVMPLDLTISPGELHGKYKAGMIAVRPFAALASNPVAAVGRLADEASSFLVAGLLLGRAAGLRPSGGRLVFAFGLAIAGSVEVAQLFVASRRFDSTDVIVGSLAVLGGWAAARATLGEPDPRRTGRARLALLVGWLGLAVASSWSPFDFEVAPKNWSSKASAISPLPFVDYYRGSVWVAADQIFRKATLFFPLGMVLGRGPRVTFLAATGLAIFLEFGQFALPARVPSLTDVVVEMGGAWAGLLCAGRRLPGDGVGGVL